MRSNRTTALAAVATLAMPALTPSIARAQAYTFNGCDYAYADVFGAGPRLCASGVVQVRRSSSYPGAQFVSISNLAVIAATGWSERTDSYNNLNLVTDLGTYDTGSNVVPGCILGTVCRGYAAEVFPLGNDAVPSAAQLQSLLLRVRYYPDAVPTGGWNGTGPTYASDVTFALTAVPEPATLALTFGGLAVLGAGAWGRRRAA